MATIPVRVDEPAAPREGTLGVAGPGARIRDIDVDTLREKLGELTDGLTQIFSGLRQVGELQLRGVEVSIEIGAEGGVALIGTAKAKASGAISLTFALPD